MQCITLLSFLRNPCLPFITPVEFPKDCTFDTRHAPSGAQSRNDWPKLRDEARRQCISHLGSFVEADTRERLRRPPARNLNGAIVRLGRAISTAHDTSPLLGNNEYQFDLLCGELTRRHRGPPEAVYART